MKETVGDLLNIKVKVKKIITEKKPRYYLEVVKTKGSRKTNGFEWRSVQVKKGKEINVQYSAVGYDTYSSAFKMAKKHTVKLSSPLPIYFGDKKIF